MGEALTQIQCRSSEADFGGIMNSDGIVKVLRKLKVTSYTPGYRNVTCSCPLAPWQHPSGKDSNPSMSIKVDPVGDSVCMCWSSSCGWAGTLVQLTKMVNHLSGGLHDAAVELAESLENNDLQARLDAILDPEPEEEDDKTFDENMIRPFSGRVPRYAIDVPPKGRGLFVETCKYWELGYDEVRYRLVVPVRNIEGHLVGMMGRAIKSTQMPKWFAYWNFRKGNFLYGEHKVDSSLNKIIVVEGMPDVWIPWQHGHKNVVALLGSRLTFAHERKLLKWGCDVYWFLDGDESGVKGTAQCIGLMRNKIKQYVVKCPEGKDPGSMTKEELDDAIGSAEFLI